MFVLKPLPFAKNALEPYISEKTLEFHYGKHHQTYVDNLNKLIASTEFEGSFLEEIIIKTASQPERVAIFNNAAQVYNHDLFWSCLSAKAEDRNIPEKVLMAINSSFGSLDNFYEQFKTAALGQFGSGWVWLVKGENGLEIIKTTNADNPLAKGLKPLLALDVWEHSYYLDYQNKRVDYIEAVVKNLFNWSFVQTNLS
ncbi:MAG: superoxide dismutase [Patescibacteria group bacterium]